MRRVPETDAVANAAIPRRSFLAGTGALVIAFSLPQGGRGRAEAAELPSEIRLDQLDSWLRIDGNGHVTLLCGKVELGTGVRTAFGQIVAEELDVKFTSVEVIHGDTARTPDQGVTSASRSIWQGGPQIRQAAAEARLALMELAAAHFNATPDQLSVSDSVVSNGGAQIAYGKLIGGRHFSRGISGKAVTKKPSAYKIVGQPIPRVDLPEKLTGHFTYVYDVKLPGMLHARVVRPARIGASLTKVVGFTRARPNIRIVSKKDFLAVVAPTEWEAIEAAADLKVEWSGGADLPPMAGFEAALRAMPSVDVVLKSAGDLDAGIKGAAKTMTATYRWPFHSHGSIGPSCAVAEVKKDGTATIWSATQDVYMQREAVARLLGFPQEKVRIIYLEGSGCYGHNGADDVNADAALLSQELGVPVRVQWMRHDEFGWEPRGAPFLADFKAGLGADGEVTAWDAQAWALTHSLRYRHYGDKVSGYLLATELSGGEIDVPLVADKGKIVNTGAIAGFVSLPYVFSNSRTLMHGLQTTTPHPLRPSEMRSVAGLGAIFASKSFVDEVAVASGKDAIQFRLAHLKDARAIAVLEAVARLSNWETRSSPNPHQPDDAPLTGRGISVYTAGTYVAMVAEVAVDRKSSAIRVTHVHVAHDCGLIVNPDGLRNQIEGNIVQGTSRSLLERVTWDAERITSLDWRSYPILRFPDVPEVHIELIDRPDVAATGAGESCTYPIAAAIANAVFDATGGRLREGPFTPERMKGALAVAPSGSSPVRG